MPPQATSAIAPEHQRQRDQIPEIRAQPRRPGDEGQAPALFHDLTTARLQSARLPLPQQRGGGERRIAGQCPALRDGIASARETAQLMRRMSACSISPGCGDAPLSRDPFEFVVVENFLDRDSLPALVARLSGHRRPRQLSAAGPRLQPALCAPRRRARRRGDADGDRGQIRDRPRRPADDDHLARLTAMARTARSIPIRRPS